MIIELNWIHFWLPRIWLGIYKSVLNPISWFLPLPNLSDKHWGKRWFILRNKLNIQKTKIMAAGPITPWQIDGETMEIVKDFILGGSKFIAGGEYSHEIKRRLLPGRIAMINLDSIWKSRDIALPTKVHLVKAMVFPVVMYGCERWMRKKAEHWRTDDFELWCWRRLLRVPWTVRRSSQSILKEISPGCSLEGLMLKLKL